MKNIFFLIVCITFFSCSKDDDKVIQEVFNGKLIWSKTFGGSDEELIRGVTSTQDGGFVVVGNTKSSDGDITTKTSLLEDIWLSKYDVNGNLVWSKTYGGSLDDLGYSIIENLDGTLTVAGYSKSSDGDVPSNLGMHDFFIFKTDANGNLIWKKSYGFMSHDHAHKIISTSDGGYFVMGYADYGGFGKTSSRNNTVLHGVGEYYGIKLNAAGDKEWDRYFGGTLNERIFDAVQSNDGGLIMVGYSESNDFDVTDNHGGYDYWIIKLSITGNLIWKKSYGGSGLDQAFGIAKTNNNSYLIVGTSNSEDGDVTSNKGANDVWVIHVDDNGNKLWDKSFGGSQFDSANSIRTMSNGNFLISGHTRSNDLDVNQNKGENDFWAFTISPSGQMLWQKTFGGSNLDFAYDAIETLDKSIIIVGETESNDFDITMNKGSKDLLIIKVH
jgi:hypothetical protein